MDMLPLVWATYVIVLYWQYIPPFPPSAKGVCRGRPWTNSFIGGADDMDGTIDDSTKIYSMAGAEESKPSVTTAEMEAMIRSAGYEPVERDTFYNPVKK